MRFPLQILLCILIATATIYVYIDKQNELTALRMEIPQLERQLHAIEEENIRLSYEINQFENPVHLMELSRKPEFSHLKFPSLDTVWVLADRETPSNEN